MIALEKKKLEEKMDNDDSDDTDSQESDRDGLEAQDDNTINLNAMLYKDQNSEFSNMTTGSLKVDKTPQLTREQIQQAQNLQQRLAAYNNPQPAYNQPAPVYN